MVTPSSSPQPPPPPRPPESMVTSSSSRQPPPPPQDPDHHQSLPSSTPSNPSSPKPIPTSPSKKIPPVPWTHEETVNLIQAYQEKWYSLKRGQLKVSQWEEISITVAARCGYDEPSKSAVQCRHKIEKLRKRYRSEKLKPYPNSWQFFNLMDRMERGPLSASSMAMVMYQKSNSSDHDNEEGDGDDEDEDEFEVNYCNDMNRNKSKSINHIVRGEMKVNKANFVGGSDRVLRVPTNRKRKEYFESDEEEVEVEVVEEEEGGGGDKMMGELAVEIRGFAENFMRMESNRIEMMKETERYRMEMENKRTEMFLESQKKIADTIGRALVLIRK